MYNNISSSKSMVMCESGFQLIVELVRPYLCQKFNLPSTSVLQTLSSDTHSQWTLQDSPQAATISATKLSDENTVLNFISGETIRAVQVPLSGLGVSMPVEKAKIKDLGDVFASFVDTKLLEQGGFWQKSKPTKNQPDSESHDQKLAPALNSDFSKMAVNPGPRPFTRPADMPDFDDEYDLKKHGSAAPQLGNFGIGERDLYPPGVGRDPLMKPYLDPLADVGGGGMYPTADHPMFGQRQGNTSRSGVPPGARYDDPYGENNLEDMGMGLPGNLRKSGGGFGGPPSGGSFGGHPFGGGMF
ncbi:hypothetical protein OXX69_006535 [Metschnikowia pulcherrima]